MLTVVNADGNTPNGFLIDEIVREGARGMLAAASVAEVNACIAELADQLDGEGRRLVVSNGYRQLRSVTTVAGAVEVRAPRVTDKRVDETTGERKWFASSVLPPWCRKFPKIREVLPPLHLHGVSSGDFVPALEQFLGSSVGLSPATVTRLTTRWQAEHKTFGERDLADGDYVYVWADGIHPRIRLEEAKAAVLVVVGVRADGTEELIVMTDGYRESSESWANLLRDCARRSMRTPVLAVGDGALGFWNALNEVFPEARRQRCWMHRTASVLGCLAKSAQFAAKKAVQDIYDAEDREHAAKAIKVFAQQYGAKFPKGVKRIVDDEEELLAFYDFRAEHCIHLRTTNPIESAFATVRLRTKVTKGAGCRAAALATVFKLVESAQARRRAVKAPHLVALVPAGALFERGHLVERPEVVAV
ncbi:IS256 family transposase [Streptomyces canus]|uniref:IS256 family transposase n=1 Tax=Streptomyces canus TaxID=58343 RepID=UPI0033A191B5